MDKLKREDSWNIDDEISKIVADPSQIYTSIYCKTKSPYTEEYYMLISETGVADLLSSDRAYVSPGDIYGLEEQVNNMVLHSNKRDEIGKSVEYLEVVQDIIITLELYPKYPQTELNRCYLFWDQAEGVAKEVIRIETDRINILTKYLYQYQKIKQLYLVKHFYYSFPIEKDYVNQYENGVYKPNDNLVYELWDNRRNLFASMEPDNQYTNMIVLMGNKIIPYTEEMVCKDKNVCVDFIVHTVIKNGEEDHIYVNCNRDNLYEPYISEDTSKYYTLTPVFFKKSVLDKYYSDHKYQIKDMQLMTTSKDWSLPVDNNIPYDYVACWLCDLGNLPELEQSHWKSYNISPIHIEATITHDLEAYNMIKRYEVAFKKYYNHSCYFHLLSESFIVRQIDGQFHAPESDIFAFLSNLKKLEKYWYETFGFYLYGHYDIREFEKNQLQDISLQDHPNNINKKFIENIKYLQNIIIETLNLNQIKEYVNNNNYTKCQAILSNKNWYPLNLFNQFLLESNKPELKILYYLQDLRSYFSHADPKKKYEAIIADMMTELHASNIQDRNQKKIFQLILQHLDAKITDIMK